MSLKTINELTPPGQNQTVKLRITRIWEVFIPTTQRNLGIAFLAFDNQGQGIHVHIPESTADKFRPMLMEGMLYHVSRFQVVNPYMTHLTVIRNYGILFNRNTILKPIPDDPAGYPRHFFHFDNDEKLFELANSDKYLTDSYGVLVKIVVAENILIPKQNKTGKKEVIIKRISGDEMKITVWEGCFNQMDDDLLLSLNPPLVLIFDAVSVRTFRDTIYLQTTSPTKIYVDLDIPEKPQIEAVNESLAPANATIAELLSFEPKKIQRTIFKAEVTVDELNLNNGWYYKACNLCNKKVNEPEGSPINCTYHGEKIVPRIKMRLPIRISDDTDSMDITIFDKEAEQMTNTYITSLMSNGGVSEEKVPDGVLNILNKKFRIVIGLTQRAVEENSPTYKIYDAVQVIDIQKRKEMTLTNSQTKEDDDNDKELEKGDTLSSPIDAFVENDLFPSVSPLKKKKTR
ncbi:Nucleic acid-binding protein [Corchorus capsularis]|uniref:Nucleic acid-binding protein n=1 Tax=Corchorus capsularis TaxID=210143 RepID=A0A1R3HC01_COCAP|nr:Nucleic acid-binding protein [Corchorus capsularis]